MLGDARLKPVQTEEVWGRERMRVFLVCCAISRGAGICYLFFVQQSEQRRGMGDVAPGGNSLECNSVAVS